MKKSHLPDATNLGNVIVSTVYILVHLESHLEESAIPDSVN